MLVLYMKPEENHGKGAVLNCIWLWEKDWGLPGCASPLVPSLAQQYFTGCISAEPLYLHCILDNLWYLLEGSRILD